MLQIEKQKGIDSESGIELELTYLNQKNVCRAFWSKLRSDNKRDFGSISK